MHAAVLTPLTEVSYLTAQNAPLYRAIMRTFYLEKGRLHMQLRPQEVLALLRERDDGEVYTPEQVEPALKMLVGWKNLIAVQDPGHVATIEEYLNRQFRYSITDAASEVEEMTLRLETRFLEGNALSGRLFEQILVRLRHLQEIWRSAPHKELSECWHSILEDFRRVNRNYQDFIKSFLDVGSDRLLRSTEFLLQKDAFLTYLREFVQTLQSQSGRIARVLQALQEEEPSLLERLTAAEEAIPRMPAEAPAPGGLTIAQNVRGNWQSLLLWFVEDENGESESRKVMAYTDDVIRRIIQNAALLIQLQSLSVSRREDYRRYMALFYACKTTEEAHCLSAHLFGASAPAHFVQNAARTTDDINSRTADEPPLLFPVEPHTRSYKPRAEKAGFASRAAEKARYRDRQIELRREKEALIARYLTGSVLDLSAIRGTVPALLRQTLLKWISQALSSKDRKAVTEYGRSFVLETADRQICLNCEDGDLWLPAYRIRFEQEENHE